MSCVRVRVTPISNAKNVVDTFLVHAAIPPDVTTEIIPYAIRHLTDKNFDTIEPGGLGMYPIIDSVTQSPLTLGLSNADAVRICIHGCTREELIDRVLDFDDCIKDIIKDTRRERLNKLKRATPTATQDPPPPYEPAMDARVIEETNLFHADTYRVFAPFDDFTRSVYALHHVGAVEQVRKRPRHAVRARPVQ